MLVRRVDTSTPLAVYTDCEGIEEVPSGHTIYEQTVFLALRYKHPFFVLALCPLSQILSLEELSCVQSLHQDVAYAPYQHLMPFIIPTIYLVPRTTAQLCVVSRSLEQKDEGNEEVTLIEYGENGGYVHMLDSEGGWVYIRTDDGVRGWVCLADETRPFLLPSLPLEEEKEERKERKKRRKKEKGSKKVRYAPIYPELVIEEGREEKEEDDIFHFAWLPPPSSFDLKNSSFSLSYTNDEGEESWSEEMIISELHWLSARDNENEESESESDNDNQTVPTVWVHRRPKPPSTHAKNEEESKSKIPSLRRADVNEK